MKTLNFIPYFFAYLADRYSEQDYFAYETPSESFFTVGYETIIKLFSTKVEVIDKDGNKSVMERKYSPAEELRYYTKNYFVKNRRIFGWLTFEFCIEELKVSDKQINDELLAILFIPKTELRFLDNNIDIFGDEKLANEIKTDINKHLDFITSANIEATVNNIDYKQAGNYKERVKLAVAEINGGKYDKVILSRKVPVLFDVDFAKTYLNGRLANTPARSFVLKYGDFSALGFSPELILRVESDGKVITEPLAGTRVHLTDEKQNNKLKQELYTDPKEVFEHAVSVKTSCEEIIQISENCQANVSEFMVIKNRGAVQHLASSVEGKLAENKDVFDALSVLFPSVTASGLPKKEAIDAIMRLDENPRELYSGGVGYIDPNGIFEMTLVLRSLFKNKNEIYLRAGAGIISTSVPDREFEETCEKLASIAPFLFKKYD